MTPDEGGPVETTITWNEESKKKNENGGVVGGEDGNSRRRKVDNSDNNGDNEMKSDNRRPSVNVIEEKNVGMDCEKIKFEPQVKWLDLSGLLFVHLGCIYGLYLLVLSRSFKNYIWRKLYKSKKFFFLKDVNKFKG